MTSNKSDEFINTPEALQQFCDSIKGEQWIAIDTEFHRDQNYYSELCLVQIGTPQVAVCIDPLAINNLDPLLDVLYDTSITKVIHAGRQDLEIFYHMRGALPQPIFDTQVAAPLLGLDEQMGYGALVKAMLNTNLDKNHSRADWKRRPMPKAQMQYALDDVVFLAKLYPKMLDRLEKLGRIDWLQDDFDNLLNSEIYKNPPEKAWQRLRAANKLKPQQLSVLQALATWREQTAQKQDRPRNWVCKDDVLLDMSKLMPGDLTELGHIRGIGENFVSRFGKKLVSLIASARNQKPEPLPDFKIKQKLTTGESAVIDAMSAMVALCADRNSLHPSAIANRKDIEALFRGEADAILVHGWRKQIAGDLLQTFLDGDLALSIDRHELTTQKISL